MTNEEVFSREFLTNPFIQARFEKGKGYKLYVQHEPELSDRKILGKGSYFLRENGLVVFIQEKEENIHWAQFFTKEKNHFHGHKSFTLPDGTELSTFGKITVNIPFKITPQQRAEVWKESTANGMGEYFHKLWMDSLSPKHVDFYKFCETLAQEEQMKKQEKQKEETFDFYEAMRRMYNGAYVENENEPGRIHHFHKISGSLIDQEGVRCGVNKKAFDEMWKEVKAQPETFGWHEAYRLMKEGE